MLAEPRRKQKGILTPNGGKEWSQDLNKYGQRMLEKMGWTNGKGLGVNEQGMTKHVHVSFKNDTTGIGYKNTSDEAWTEHRDNFNDFLQKLQENENYNVLQKGESKNALSGKSLELKSKQSRVRVHYQKFTKQKDVSKYSSKDLANIFGQKQLNINENSKTEEDNDNKNSNSVGAHDVIGNNIITINGGNMTEYFMKKSQNLSSASKYKKQEETDIEKKSENADFASTFRKVNSHDNEKINEIKSTCNYAFENPCIELNSPENISDNNNESEFSKRRKSNDDEHLNNKINKFKDDSINENSYANGIVNAGLNLECEANEIYNGEKFEVSRVQFGLTNSALDLSDEVNDKKRVTFNDHVEYSTDCIKKKKNRTTLDKFEVENKKAKKKKKRNSTNNKSGCVNEALDIETNEEIHDNEINERKSKKSKKRKKSRRSNLETIVEISEEKACEDETEIKRTKMEDNVPNNYVLQDVSNRKKKKKKHKNKIQDAIENDEKYDEKNIERETISDTNVMFEEEKCKIAEDQENIQKKQKRSETKKKKKKTRKVRDTESELKKNEDVISVTETEVNNDVENKKAKDDDIVNDLSSVSKNVKNEIEISDKENIKDMERSEIKKPKKRKNKKLVNKSTNYSTHNINITEERSRVFTSTFLNNFRDEMLNMFSYSWNEKAKMSRKILTSLLHGKSVLEFPGSNVYEIKGYGTGICQNVSSL